MASAYASKQDLLGDEVVTGYLGDDAAAIVAGWSDAEIARVLSRASDVVDDIIVASYAVDGDGLPYDADMAAAVQSATCAVVEQWVEVGEENDVDGLAGSDIEVEGFKGRRAPTVGPRVLRPLRAAGLLSQPGMRP